MPQLDSIQTRYDAALGKLRTLKTSYEAADDPSDADLAELDAAIAAAETISDQLTAEQARSAKWAALQARASAPGQRLGAPLMPHTDPGNTRNRFNYSLMRAIRGELLTREGRGGLDGIEREVHDELVSLRGGKCNGVMVPLDAPVHYRGVLNGVQFRDLSTVTGAGAIPEIVRPTMIDVLRARMVLYNLGATVISDMTQPFSLPKVDTAQAGAWVATEGTTTTPSNSTIIQVPFSWRSVETHTNLTRQFIMNASVDGESFVVDQLTKAVALTVEGGALTGTGATGQPKGLFTYGSVDGVGFKALGTNGAGIDWPGVLAIKAAVDTANAPDDKRAWLFNPTTVSYLQGVAKSTGQAKFILDDDNKVANYPYGSTSLVPNTLVKGSSGAVCSALAFGSWSEMGIALFSGLDLFIDPYTAAPHVKITMAQDVDVNFLHLPSFCISKDLLAG